MAFVPLFLFCENNLMQKGIKLYIKISLNILFTKSACDIIYAVLPFERMKNNELQRQISAVARL